MSYRYPYGNTEQMNLDWFLNQWEKFKTDWAEAEAGIDGSLDAEIAKVEAAMSELYAARDAAAASATAARQSSLDATAAQVAAGNSKTAAQDAETAARGSQTAAAQSAQEAQASAQGAENSALTASQAANTATQQAAGADAAKGAAEAAQQAAEVAQAAAAQSAGQAGQAATAAGDHADDAADSATLAQQAAQGMSDSVEQITTNKNDISDLKESIGFRVINKEYGTRQSAVFTKDEVAPNSTIYYSFSVQANKSGFLEIFDSNDARITYIGKAASASGDLDYEGSYVLPENYSYAKFGGVSTSIITVHYIKAETNNDILLQKIDDAEISIEDFGELFAIGESILPQEDLYDTANTTATFTSMWQTQKASGAVYTTKIVDLGTKAGRIYAVRNIYRIYAYDTDGTYITNIQSSGQFNDDTLDFTQYPHRYIRVMVNRNARFKHDVVIGATIPDSTHRGKYPSNDLNLENLFSKRAFLSSGQLGSTQYRMPFCAYSNEGALLLGGEMRYSSGTDNKDISIAYTRSLDHGKTFETPIILFEKNTGDETYHTKSCGQFVVDEYTGKIFCFCLREDSDVNRLTTLTDKAGYNSGILCKYSTDNGATWSAEQEIDLRSSNMMIMCPSPGNGITMKDGTLVVPAWALYSDGSKRSLIIYSSDNGNTWAWSGTTVPYSSNECTIVEAETGTLLINCRCEESDYRVVYVTADKGASYTPHPSNLYSIKQAICSANLHKFFTDSGVGEKIYFYTAPFGSNRSLTKLLCTKDFVNWKELCTITTAQTSGYTCIATYEDHLIVVEEWVNNYLTCDSVRIPQTVFAAQSLKIPAESGTYVPVKGELFYNVATDKLNFMDASGNVKVIAFES